VRLGTINSKLIAQIGHENGVLRVAYKDGTVFDYTAPFSVFRKLATMKHPGAWWLSVRSKYTHKQA
jgi:hypothetical protein